MSIPAISRYDMANRIERTVAALRSTSLPLQMPGAHEWEQTRRQLITQLENRILPHVRQVSTPTVMVFGGSSGAGKSTLVNSLIGEEISQASILRPTTRTPIIVIHPDDEAALQDHALLNLGTCVCHQRAIRGVVIVDAPDLDSVDDSNRELSARLIDSADLWVFVTTASRYGDALAWNTLTMAHQRGITCAVVLDRVPDRALAPVRADLMRRMASMQMADSPLFMVRDMGPHSGLLPVEEIADIRQWVELIARTQAGNALVDRTTAATLPQLRSDLLMLADVVDLQEHARIDLRDKAREAAAAPIDKLLTNIEHGRFANGAPTTSWLSLASAGGPLAKLVARRKPRFFATRSAIRDRAMITVFESVLTSVRVALTQGLTAADMNVTEAWRQDVVQTEELCQQAAVGVDMDTIVERAVDRWKADLARRQVSPNPWLAASGTAALIGVAAGGIAGAQTIAQSLGYAAEVRQARDDLSHRVRQALRELVGVYIAVIDEIAMPPAAVLRARASEFLYQ
ncbi:GTPase domain-containing protein [Trueperella sp. LYQ143]|uniref:GTPase domain-containing protein n=1 Tax=Trueperella sp. LYQ143 TaxID=3391059 RepID=UPI0039833F5B